MSLSFVNPVSPAGMLPVRLSLLMNSCSRSSSWLTEPGMDPDTEVLRRCSHLRYVSCPIEVGMGPERSGLPLNLK